MNQTLKWCKELVMAFAAQLNMTYVELNIWIFVIIEPIVFLILLWLIYKQYRVVKSLRPKILAQ